jgi:hypothetical protein
VKKLLHAKTLISATVTVYVPVAESVCATSDGKEKNAIMHIAQATAAVTAPAPAAGKGVFATQVSQA